MDVDHLAFSSEVKNNCHGDWVELNKASGVRASAYEHIIPEMMFNTDPDNPIEGISAVKALAVAAQQNQKIYTLDLTKIDQLSNISIDSVAKNEIRNALYQGKTVTLHEKPITHFGWSGSGYIITDNDTGAGAYKISGGSNGGFLKNAKIKGTFWAGFFKYMSSNNIFFKFMTKALGQTISAIVNAFKFINQCSSLVNAIILSLVFAMISVAITIMLFFAGPIGFVLTIGLGFVETWLADRIIDIGC